MKKLLALTLAVLMLAGMAACTKAPAADTTSDLAYIQQKGTLVVGITDFAPMDYQDASGEWIGFDADMAKAFAESLGVEVQFVEIDWDSKIMELDAKTIDCVWNGMTLTGEVTESMSCSNAYCNNTQVVVVPADKAADYQSADACKSLNFAVEAGSAGEAEVEKLGAGCTPVKDQATALMAGAMVGEGTGYETLAYTVSLNADEGEQYGVGFRKGSDLTQKLNEFFQASFADGSMQKAAETYGIQAALCAQ